MNIITRNFSNQATTRAKGFTLLDVLLAILIFVVGMLALASLQTNLTRSSVDANTRTVATNIAEEILERLRSFRRVASDPNPDDGVVFAFADIDENYVETLLSGGADNTIDRGGLEYAIDAEVTGYEFNEDRTAVTATPNPAAGTLYDFKMVELNIAWNNNQQFQVDQERQVSNAGMNSGSIYIKGIIPSIPSLANAMVAVTDEGALGGIRVDFDPGARPDVLRIDLGNQKFKESTPLDTEIGQFEDETWLDVVTYNRANDDIFLRREEFLFVKCECELQSATGGGTGLMPAIWNGTEYAIRVAAGDNGYAVDTQDLRFVEKPYGVSAANDQSPFCDVCCRDHHDSSEFTNADDKFNPNLPGDEIGADGNHIHYAEDMEVVTAADQRPYYEEACRLVRKDGYMRVAQDVRQEGFVALPAGYLDSQLGGDEYSAYLEEAVRDYYESGTGVLQSPADLGYDFLGSVSSPALLPQAGVGIDGDENRQQMRSRAIYIDHVGAEAATLLNCIYQEQQGYNPDAGVDVDPPGDACGAPGLEDYLEVLPFFEVQTTLLSRWDSSNPQIVFVEGIEDSNNAEPGVATLRDSTENTQVILMADMTRDNTALIPQRQPIRPSDSRDSDSPTSPTVGEDEIFVNVNDGGEPIEPFFYSWSADLVRAQGAPQPGTVTMTPSDCGSPETCNTFCNGWAEGMECSRAAGAGQGSVTLSGYGNNRPLNLCVTSLPPGVGSSQFSISNLNAANIDRSATITWSNTRNLSGIVLTWQTENCTP